MPGSSSSVREASPPGPMTVARWRAVAVRPDQSAASLTSPPSLTHSASTSAGTSACGIPGATFTHASRPQQPLDPGPRRHPVVDVEGAPGAAAPRGVGEREVEPAVVDRGRVGDLDARRAVRGRPGWPRPRRPAPGRGRRRRTPGRRGTPRSGRRRSRTRGRSGCARRTPGSGRRGGSATDSRVACSSASGVKYIRSARSPNLALGPPAQLDLGHRGSDGLRRRRTAELGLDLQLDVVRELGRAAPGAPAPRR